MPLQLAPNESIFFSARRHRVNTPKDAPKTALNQNFDYFDMEVLQTPLPKPAPRAAHCPLIKTNRTNNNNTLLGEPQVFTWALAYNNKRRSQPASQPVDA